MEPFWAFCAHQKRRIKQQKSHRLKAGMEGKRLNGVNRFERVLAEDDSDGLNTRLLPGDVEQMGFEYRRSGRVSA